MFQVGTVQNLFQNYTFSQNGILCQSETCFRMAHVSERHATHACVMFESVPESDIRWMTVIVKMTTNNKLLRIYVGAV